MAAEGCEKRGAGQIVKKREKKCGQCISEKYTKEQRARAGVCRHESRLTKKSTAETPLRERRKGEETARKESYNEWAKGLRASVLVGLGSVVVG